MSLIAQQLDHQYFAHRLRKRYQVLREEIRNTLLRADAEQYAHIADRVQNTEDQSLAEVLAEVSHAEIARDVEEVCDITVALQRIASGDYGVCTGCGDQIPQARFEAHPTAKRCLKCQQLYEQANAR
ncbi:MAG: TraR/DksA family transcriptional regulator [Steroidobacteraceae bacterium]